MGYFRELPDLDYQSFLSDSISSQSYLRVKNLFRRNKLRDDLKGIFTVFDKYEIQDGARPDTVAEEFYGDAELDWVVLLTAGILNPRDEWPLSNYNLNKYANDLYGNQINDIHHYETKEVRDSAGKLILPAKKVVPETFKIQYYDNGQLYTNDSTILGENVIRIQNPVVGVSNFEYESLIQTAKPLHQYSKSRFERKIRQSQVGHPNHLQTQEQPEYSFSQTLG